MYDLRAESRRRPVRKKFFYRSGPHAGLFLKFPFRASERIFFGGQFTGGNLEGFFADRIAVLPYENCLSPAGHKRQDGHGSGMFQIFADGSFAVGKAGDIGGKVYAFALVYATATVKFFGVFHREIIPFFNSRGRHKDVW